jgi:hypothetical protein
MTIYRAMYGVGPVMQTSAAEQVAAREKRAVKVLGGMKIHNSHMKQVQIGEDLINVPKIEFVQLLEGQIKELRKKLRVSEHKLDRLESNYSKLATEMSTIRRDSSNRFNFRS